jgi:N-hydroxyarylamine O-acetyltransferase
MEVAPYLARLGFSGPLAPTPETLRALQLAHLLAVPFENLDISLGRPIRLDLPSLWDKIVVRKRGGFCYELNGLFAWLLENLGFHVTYLDARDYHEADDSFGIDFDHLALMVIAPGHTTRFLADVGYGDTFTLPLDIDDPAEQPQGDRSYRLEPFRGGYQLWQLSASGTRERQYFFDLTPRFFPADYAATCLYHQTSPASIFTQKRIASRLTLDGRISLTDRELIIRRGSEQTRTPVEDERDFRGRLLEYFGFGI